MKPNPIALSYSSCSNFESCPARFHAEKVLKLPQDKSFPMVLGSFLHEVCDLYIKYLMNENMDTDYEEMEAIFESLWKNRVIHKEFNILPQSMKSEAWEIMLKMRDEVKVENSDNIVGSEIELAFDRDWKRVTWKSKKVFFRMKIDRLDMVGGKAIVWDLKTGRKIDDPAKGFQCKTYALGVSKIMPNVTEFEAQLYYPRTQRTRSAEMGEKEINDALEWINGIDDSIARCFDTGTWNATPGMGCNNCVIKSKCPALAQGKNTTLAAPGTIDEAQDLVSEYILADNKRKDIVAKLRAFVEANGPVTHNGVSAGFSESVSRSYHMAKFFAYLKEHGVDAGAVVNADKTKLKKYIKRDKELARKLDAIAVEKATSRFTVK